MSFRQDSKLLTAARTAVSAAVWKADFEVKSAAPLETLKVARLDFSGGIPPKFERQLCRRE